jgi:hypothetical protein
MHIGGIGIDPSAHAVLYCRNGTHRTSTMTMPYAAAATIAAFTHSNATKNNRIFMSAFVASERDIVADMKKLQGATYAVSHASVDVLDQIRDKLKADEEQPGAYQSAQYETVTASVLLPEYQAGSVTLGKIRWLTVLPTCRS